MSGASTLHQENHEYFMSIKSTSGASRVNHKQQEYIRSIKSTSEASRVHQKHQEYIRSIKSKSGASQVHQEHLEVYHSFCRKNQMKKSLYLVNIAKLDRYERKSPRDIRGVPNIFHFNETKYFWRHPVFMLFNWRRKLSFHF